MINRAAKFLRACSFQTLFAVSVVAAGFVPTSPRAEDNDATVEDTLPDHASPSACVVIIDLAVQASAIKTSAANAYKEAEKVFREKSVELNEGTDGSNQMIGSSVAFFEHLSAAQLNKGAQMCLAAVDEGFDADE